jgi:hypothetical protein
MFGFSQTIASMIASFILFLSLSPLSSPSAAAFFFFTGSFRSDLISSARVMYSRNFSCTVYRHCFVTGCKVPWRVKGVCPIQGCFCVALGQ